MKKIRQLTRNKALIYLAISLVELNLTPAATGQITASFAVKQVRRCIPTNCTPYRANYERAIANGTIGRPTLVADENLAIALADRALSRGDRNEAAIRLAQAIVIISEKHGISQAINVERGLDADIKKTQGQSLREFLPLFDRIFPPNKDPYQ